MNTTGGLDWAFKGQQLRLLARKALYWMDEKALVVSDVHLGKVGHFRKAGIAIPRSLEQEDLATLSDLLHELKPRQVIFLGDLFHSDMNNDWQWLKLWRGLFPEINMVLVQGNHDVLHDRDYLDAGFELVQELQAGPFLFVHEPTPARHGLYTVSGHLHPGVRLFGKGRQTVTLPCFYFGGQQAILPAFGRFTGCVALRRNEGDVFFGILNDKVLSISPA